MFQCSYRDAKSSFHLPKNHSKTRENIKCILGISAMISLDTIAHYSYENSYLLLFSRIIWLCQQSEASDLLCESIGKKKSWILMPVVSCSGPWWPCTGLWGGGGSRESEWRCRLNANYSVRIDCTEAELGMVWAHAKWYRDTEALPGAGAVYCQMQGRQELWGNFHQSKWRNLITSSRKSYKGDSVQ